MKAIEVKIKPPVIFFKGLKRKIDSITAKAGKNNWILTNVEAREGNSWLSLCGVYQVHIQNDTVC